MVAIEVTNQSIKNWRAQEVEKAFGIRRVRKSELLDAWLNAEPVGTERQWAEVERLRRSAEEDIDTWNEPALKFLFIGPLVSLIDFSTEHYNNFLEQTLTVSNDEVSARGYVDYMVAHHRHAGRPAPQ